MDSELVTRDLRIYCGYREPSVILVSNEVSLLELWPVLEIHYPQYTIGFFKRNGVMHWWIIGRSLANTRWSNIHAFLISWLISAFVSPLTFGSYLSCYAISNCAVS